MLHFIVHIWQPPGRSIQIRDNTEKAKENKTENSDKNCLASTAGRPWLREEKRKRTIMTANHKGDDGIHRRVLYPSHHSTMSCIKNPFESQS